MAVDTDDLRTHNTNLVVRDADGNVTGFQSRFTLIDVIGGLTYTTAHPPVPGRLSRRLGDQHRSRNRRGYGGFKGDSLML